MHVSKTALLVPIVSLRQTPTALVYVTLDAPHVNVPDSVRRARLDTTNPSPHTPSLNVAVPTDSTGMWINVPIVT